MIRYLLSLVFVTSVVAGSPTLNPVLSGGGSGGSGGGVLQPAQFYGSIAVTNRQPIVNFDHVQSINYSDAGNNLLLDDNGLYDPANDVYAILVGDQRILNDVVGSNVLDFSGNGNPIRAYNNWRFFGTITGNGSDLTNINSMNIVGAVFNPNGGSGVTMNFGILASKGLVSDTGTRSISGFSFNGTTVTATNGVASYATSTTTVPVIATGFTNTTGVTGFLPITAATGLVRYDCQSNIVSTSATVTSPMDVVLQNKGWATWTTITTNGLFHAW